MDNLRAIYQKIISPSTFLLAIQLCAWAHLPLFIQQASMMHYLIVLGIYVWCMVIGMTMTFHKYLCHNKRKDEWDLPRWLVIVGTLSATWSAVGSSLGWSAKHLEHHPFSDTPKDPHSPHNDGFFKTQFLSMYGAEPKLKYVAHLLRDDFHIRLHRLYPLIHVIALFLTVLFPLWGATLYLIPALLVWNCGSLVNTWSHMFGYRRYETKDKSTNNLFVGWITLGEWHNNHHGEANNYNYGRAWWEFDASYHIIKWFNIK